MKTIFTKLGTGALVAALMATPVFALANSAHKKTFAPRTVGSTLEVMISDNGKTVVRGAQVTGVSGSTITAQTIWDASSITWTVRTDSDTDFVRKSGNASDIGDISDGDYISFSGTLSSGSSFSVTADVVKNWSLEENRAVLKGTVTDVDEDSFTLSTRNRGNVTVEVDADTAYTGRLEAFGDIDVNEQVFVSGAYDANAKVLAAASISLTSTAKYDKPNGKAWGHWFKKVSAFFGDHR